MPARSRRPSKPNSARRDSRKARLRRRRRKLRHIPPVVPTPPQGIFLPYDDSWRTYYNDTSRIKCGPFALCEMLSVHHGRTFDPEFVWTGIHGTTGSSVWDNVNFAKSQGWLRDFKYFRDDGDRTPVENARLTLAEGLAFMVICNYYQSGHIWCVTGINETDQTILTPQNWGLSRDEAVPFEDFNKMLLQQPPFEAAPNYAICCVGTY